MRRLDLNNASGTSENLQVFWEGQGFVVQFTMIIYKTVTFLQQREAGVSYMYLGKTSKARKHQK